MRRSRRYEEFAPCPRENANTAHLWTPMCAHGERCNQDVADSSSSSRSIKIARVYRIGRRRAPREIVMVARPTTTLSATRRQEQWTGRSGGSDDGDRSTCRRSSERCTIARCRTTRLVLADHARSRVLIQRGRWLSDRSSTRNSQGSGHTQATVPRRGGLVGSQVRSTSGRHLQPRSHLPKDRCRSESRCRSRPNCLSLAPAAPTAGCKVRYARAAGGC